MYTLDISPAVCYFLSAFYIEGIGTVAGNPDSIIGQGLGIADTVFVDKTDKAIDLLSDILTLSFVGIKCYSSCFEL
ncbi:type VI secretion protein, partial [Erwinia amylovora]|nr:type VI secretion protein [Erwinia amylovora]